jgi:phage-related minor tail protein
MPHKVFPRQDLQEHTRQTQVLLAQVSQAPRAGAAAAALMLQMCIGLAAMAAMLAILAQGYLRAALHPQIQQEPTA